MSELFVQPDQTGVNLYPRDLQAMRWLYLQVAKYSTWSLITANDGGWCGVRVHDTGVWINKLVDKYNEEAVKDTPEWSQQHRATNMKLSSEYRDFVKKQDKAID